MVARNVFGFGTQSRHRSLPLAGPADRSFTQHVYEPAGRSPHHDVTCVVRIRISVKVSAVVIAIVGQFVTLCRSKVSVDMDHGVPVSCLWVFGESPEFSEREGEVWSCTHHGVHDFT